MGNVLQKEEDWQGEHLHAKIRYMYAKVILKKITRGREFLVPLFPKWLSHPKNELNCTNYIFQAMRIYSNSKLLLPVFLTIERH